MVVSGLRDVEQTLAVGGSTHHVSEPVLDRRRHVAEPVIALDAGAGWALLSGRWLILGAPTTGAHRLVTPAEVMRRAAAWIDRRADDPD